MCCWDGHNGKYRLKIGKRVTYRLSSLFESASVVIQCTSLAAYNIGGAVAFTPCIRQGTCVQQAINDEV